MTNEELDTILNELKQIETEFGISLVTLFKALKKGIYQKELHFQHRGTHLDRKYLRLNLWDECLEWTDIWNGGDVYEYYFSDYGKTWALTKEELKE